MISTYRTLALFAVILACLLGARCAKTEDTSYSPLFSAALDVEGPEAEKAGTVLMDLFIEDPARLVGALSLSSPEEVQRVADLMAFDADRRSLDDYREQLEGLASGCVGTVTTGGGAKR